MSESWYVDLRDPVVLRDGRVATGLDAGPPFALPPPSTFAGMVRARFIANGDEDDARRVLGIRIVRGPWISERRADGTFVPWLAAPADAVVGSTGDPPALHRATIIEAGAGERVYWSGEVLPRLASLPERDAGRKTESVTAEFPFWSHDDVVRWLSDRADLSLPQRPAAPWHRADAERRRATKEERRVHVRLDEDTGTASHGMLFGSAGIRFGEQFGLAAEIVLPWDVPSRGVGPEPVRLGGDDRMAFRTTLPAAAFPGFPEAAFARGVGQGRLSGLRLQLVTPACLGQGTTWLPEWWSGGTHPLVPGYRLTVQAACVTGFTVTSGWNIQAKAPRRVRRLVPAGSVYYVQVTDDRGREGTPDALVSIARTLWASPLDVVQDESPEEFQAAAHADGFGMVLPGLWWDTASNGGA